MSLWSGHVRRVAEYCDGRMSAADGDRVTRHLAECARCRASVDEFHFTAGLLKQLAVVSAPDAVWQSIEAAFAQATAGRGHLTPRRKRLPSTLALAASVVLAVGLATGAYWYLTRGDALGGPSWQVARVEGSGPAVAAGAVRPGEFLQTDATSRLRLTVGTIGTVDVAPNTRVRLLSARDAEQRLLLERGEITATISAPPRLFFVNTASSTVVDLGCQYTMRTDEDGLGRLQVTLGWASLEWSGRESLVPAGASAETRPDLGPGMPSFDDAPAALRDAAVSFDFDKGGAGAPGAPAAIDTMLASARVRDTLTLWHLLRRVDTVDRGRVFDRMATLTPLPTGITREKALQLDRATMEKWRQELAWTW